MKNRLEISRVAVLVLTITAVFLSGCSTLQEDDTSSGVHHPIVCPPNDNQINCQVPPAPTECLKYHDSQYLDFDKGESFLIEPGKRAEDTRSPVHTHPNTGATCVLQGEMTLILEGQENKTFRGNLLSLKDGKPGTVECYPMPAPTGGAENKMSAVNTGEGPAYIIDIFPIPERYENNKGDFKPLCVLQNEGLPTAPACYVTGDGCQAKEPLFEAKR